MTVTVEQIQNEAAILNAKVTIANCTETIKNQFNILNNAILKLHELLPDEHLCAYSVSLSTPNYLPVQKAAVSPSQEVLS